MIERAVKILDRLLVSILRTFSHAYCQALSRSYILFYTSIDQLIDHSYLFGLPGVAGVDLRLTHILVSMKKLLKTINSAILSKVNHKNVDEPF